MVPPMEFQLKAIYYSKIKLYLKTDEIYKYIEIKPR